jgi:single-stranded DNA-specific DHH superfamily exonuclease
LKDLNKCLDDAIKNIEEDRLVTRGLLDDVIVLLSKDEENHKYAGMVAAKYVETLQRSNEQLVKVATLIQKQSTDANLSDTDKKNIFEMLQNEHNSDEVAD